MPTTRIVHLAALAVLAVLVVAACGGGSAPGGAGAGSPAAATSPAASLPESPAASADATSGGAGSESVSIRNFAFQPADVPVSTGTTVTWTNNDDAPHTVKWSDGAPESDQLAKGDTYERTFDTPGTFDYICGIHPTMMGSVTVSE